MIRGETYGDSYYFFIFTFNKEVSRGVKVSEVKMKVSGPHSSTGKWSAKRESNEKKYKMIKKEMSFLVLLFSDFLVQ